MSYGPPIETLQDWNDRLAACGCCEIPVIPAPLLARCQVTDCIVPIGRGFALDPDPYTIYQRRIERIDVDYNFSDTWGTPPHRCGGGSLTRSGSAWQEKAEIYDQNYRLCSDSSSHLSYETTGEGSWSSTETKIYCIQCPPDFTPQSFEQVILTESRSASYNPSTSRFEGSWTKNETDWYYTCDGSSSTSSSTSGTSHGSNITDVLGGSPTYTTRYELGTSYTSWLADALPILSAALESFDPGSCSAQGSAPGSVLTLTEHPGGIFIYDTAPKFTATYQHIRWFVPASHQSDGFLLHHCQVTYDLVFFPHGGGTPSLVEADVSAVLDVLSPGDPAPDTWDFGPGPAVNGWWVDDWYPIPVPAAPGQIRPVNARYTYMNTTPYGTPPPTPFGEAIEI